ncbi:MAG: NUDIX domain-containing protein [Chloroflexi bacterium]|nr:NUDIX domain-containing protein [Chloroflexota bacterium]
MNGKRRPTVGVAIVVRDGEGRVLLGKRAVGWGAGEWCIPCGSLEWGEDVRTAAARELLEETGLRARAGEVVAVHSNFHDPERLTVGIWFAGEDVEGEPVPADGELSEIRYFDPADPPPLAFPTDALVLAELARERSG